MPSHWRRSIIEPWCSAQPYHLSRYLCHLESIPRYIICSRRQCVMLQKLSFMTSCVFTVCPLKMSPGMRIPSQHSCFYISRISVRRGYFQTYTSSNCANSTSVILQFVGNAGVGFAGTLLGRNWTSTALFDCFWRQHQQSRGRRKNRCRFPLVLSLYWWYHWQDVSPPSMTHTHFEIKWNNNILRLKTAKLMHLYPIK